MRLTALFPQFRGLRLDCLRAEPIGLTLVAVTTAKGARCPRKTFRERLPALVAPGARRSHGLRAALEAIGFALGGEAGRRLAATVGMPTSGNTLLRLVRAAPPVEVEPPRALGIDDWAWRKATRYGTILSRAAPGRSGTLWAASSPTAPPIPLRHGCGRVRR